MRIDVQEVRIQQHAKIRAQRHGAQPRHVVGIALVEPTSVHPLGGENSARACVRHHGRRGHHLPKLVGACAHRRGERLAVPRLETVVELVNEAASPLVNQRLRVEITILVGDL